MKARTISKLLVGLLLVGLVVQGCAPAPTPTPVPTATPKPTATPQPTAPPQPTATPEPAATPAGVTLTDTMGHSVHFDELPQRIVIAGRNPLPVTENVFMFSQAEERVVGYAHGGKQNPADFLRHVYPTFMEKPTMRPDAGAEQVTALQPDAVVMQARSYETLGTSLQALGIPVIALELETPQQFSQATGILAKLFGNPQRGEEIGSYVQAKLDAVNEGIERLQDEERPSILLLQYSETAGEAAVEVPPGSYLQTIMVEMAGGAPVWKDVSGSGWTVVNLEQVAAWNPDIILVVHYSADSREAVATLQADNRWQELKAVKEGRMYGFAGDFFSWDQPDPRWILGVTWLAGKLHPERFPDLDMEQEVTEFFAVSYGMDEASVQTHILPNLKGDVE